MGVAVHGVRELRKARAIERAFGCGPAEISSGARVVDFFPGALSHVVDVGQACTWLNAERERIPEPPGPDETVLSRRRGEKRVVGRNLRGRVGYGIHPDDLAQQVGHRLRMAAGGVLAVSGIEHPVRAEVHGAAVVVGRAAQVVEVEDDNFSLRRVCDIPVGFEAADAIVDGRRRGGVIHVHVLVGREVRIEGHTQEATFPGGIHRHADEWRRKERSVLDDAQLPGLIGHKEPAIGRKLHGRRRRGQAVHEQHILEPGGKAGRSAPAVRRPARGDEQGHKQDPQLRAYAMSR